METSGVWLWLRLLAARVRRLRQLRRLRLEQRRQ